MQPSAWDDNEGWPAVEPCLCLVPGASLLCRLHVVSGEYRWSYRISSCFVALIMHAALPYELLFPSLPHPQPPTPTTPLPRNPHFCDPLHLCPGTPTFVTRFTSAPEPPLLWPASPLPGNPHFCEKLKQQKWKAWERKERNTCQRLIANTAWTLTVVWPPTKVHFVAHFLLMDFGVWTPCPFVVHFLLMDFGGWTLSSEKVYLAPFLYCACVLGCFVNVWWMTSNFLSHFLDLSSVQTGVMLLLVHVH